MTHGLDARTHSNPRMVVVVSSTPIAVSSKPVAVASTPVAVAPTAVPVASKPGLGASAPVAGVEAAAAASTQAETVDPIERRKPYQGEENLEARLADGAATSTPDSSTQVTAASIQVVTVDPATEEPRIPVVTPKKKGRPFKVPDKRGRWRQMKTFAFMNLTQTLDSEYGIFHCISLL